MTPELVSLAQIARYLGVTPAALSNWQARYKAEFPKPLKIEGRRKLFNLEQVVAFVRERGLAESASDRLLEAISPDEDVKAREKVDGFIRRTLGELRNDVTVDEALRFTAALAVRTALNRDQISLTPVGRQALDETYRDFENHATRSTTTICRSLEKVWADSAPDISPREIAKSIYRSVGWHARVIGRFEHATSESLARLVQLLAPGKRVLNIGSGLGLIAQAYGEAGSKLIGQEINRSCVTFHLLLSALSGASVNVLEEDAITSPHPEWRTEPFDAVISNPPWNAGVNPERVDISDPRWRALSEFRSKNLLDYFIESSIAYLRQSNGQESYRAILCVPPSWLFSEQSVRMRNFLVRNEYVEGVIQLGDGISLGTSVPPALLVLSKRSSPRHAVRMIDARGIGVRQHPRLPREIPGVQIDELVDAFNAEKAEDWDNIRVVDIPLDDLRNEQVLLVPSRYTAKPESNLKPDEALRLLDPARETMITRLRLLSGELEQFDGASLLDLLQPLRSIPPRKLNLSDTDREKVVYWTVKTRQKGSEFSADDIHRDDVVVCLGGTALGRAERGESIVHGRISWPRGAVMRVVNRTVLDPRFLLVWASFGGLKEFLEGQKVSVTTPFLGRHVLEDVSIAIPQPDVQDKIVAWFEPLMTLKEAMPWWNYTNADLVNVVKNGGKTSIPMDRMASQIALAASTILQSALGPVVKDR